MLEEPHELEPGTELLVTVLPATENAFASEIQAMAEQGLAKAYGQDEPDYPDSMIAEPNPEYGKG